MKRASSGAAWMLLAACLGGLVSACGAAQAAAAKDPMRCERDPKCSRGRSVYPDCSLQCADDPECMRRCEEIQEGVDSAATPRQ